MRINSGEYKYRNIEIPHGIRPTTEKVREAVFSIIGYDIAGANVLDLFAGSGVMGLEALSRGADHCIFNDINRANIKIIKKNIMNCGADQSSTVFNLDFRKVLSAVDRSFDIVFMDPPYEAGYYDEAMHLLSEYQLMNRGGMIIAEHLYDNKLSDQSGDFYKIKEKRYGTIGIDVFEKA